jgi:S1-C subfamily serine protease
LHIYGFVTPAIIADPGLTQQRFEEIFIVGGPAGDFPIIIDTYISSFLNRSDIRIGKINANGAPFLLTSEQTFPGHSGSPIYNERGEVVGVIFGALPTYGGVGASHKDIYDLLQNYEDSL